MTAGLAEINLDESIRSWLTRKPFPFRPIGALVACIFLLPAVSFLSELLESTTRDYGYTIGWLLFVVLVFTPSLLILITSRIFYSIIVYRWNLSTFLRLHGSITEKVSLAWRVVRDIQPQFKIAKSKFYVLSRLDTEPYTAETLSSCRLQTANYDRILATCSADAQPAVAWVALAGLICTLYENSHDSVAFSLYNIVASVALAASGFHDSLAAVEPKLLDRLDLKAFPEYMESVVSPFRIRLMGLLGCAASLVAVTYYLLREHDPNSLAAKWAIGLFMISIAGGSGLCAAGLWRMRRSAVFASSGLWCVLPFLIVPLRQSPIVSLLVTSVAIGTLFSYISKMK